MEQEMSKKEKWHATGKEVTFKAVHDIDTAELVDYIFAIQKSDWGKFVEDVTESGQATEEEVLSYVRGVLSGMDKIIDYVIQSGAVEEVRDNEA